MSVVKIRKILDTFEIPKEFRVDKSTYINDSEKFFNSHLNIVESNLGGKMLKRSYYLNMVKAIKVLKTMNLKKKTK